MYSKIVPIKDRKNTARRTGIFGTTTAGLVIALSFIVSVFGYSFTGGSLNATVSSPASTAVMPPAPVVITAPTASIVAGSNFEAAITINNSTGLDNSVNFDITYDPAVLTFTGCNNAGTLSSPFTATCNETPQGTIRTAITGNNNTTINGPGVILKLKFTVIGARGSNSPLNFVPGSINFYDPATFQPVPTTSVDGNIHIVDTQTITVTQEPPASAIYGTTFQVNATGGGSGNAVTVSTTGSCSASGPVPATVTMTAGTGTCVINFDQAGAADWAPAATVTRNVTASLRPVTVSADPKTKVYGSPDPSLSYQVTSGSLVTGDSFSGALTRQPGESVGSYNILQGTLALNANYSLTYQGNTLSISAKAITATGAAIDKVYDGTPTASATCSLTGVVSGDTVNCDVTSANFSSSTVGNGKTVTVNVALSGPAAANYSVTTPVLTTANITPKALTATATATNKVYDGNTTAAATCSLTGVVGGDTVNCGVTSANFDTAAVGNNKNVSVAVAISGLSASNYSVGTPVNTTANITPKTLTAVAVAQDKVYNGDTLTTATCSIPSGVVGSDVVNCVVGAAAFDTPTVGNNKTVNVSVSLTGASAGNYTVGTPVQTTANITPKALTAVASASNKVYDGNPTASATCSIPSGIVGSDVVNCSVASATFNNSNVGTGKAVTVNVTLTGASAGNYSVGTPVTTSADITPKALTATASASNKVYDGNTTATATCSLTGVVGSDTVNCGVTSATFDTASVGTNKNVTVAVAISGGSAGNYTVGTPVTTTANITPKALTATASATNKVYDGNTTASATCSLTGVVGSDVVNCGVTSATFDTPNVGNGKLVTVAVAISGGAAGNYTVGSPVTTAANITPKALTANAAASNKVYDGNPTASAPCSITGGIVGSDVVSCSVASATFNNSNVGTGKAVTVNVTLTGASAGNYTLGTPLAASADITPKALTATAVASNKVYDDNTTGSATCSLTGVVGGDTVNCGVTSATFDTASVGTNKNVTVAVAISGGSAGNYTVGSPVTATANITPKALTATAAATNKVYDGNTTASATCSLTGVVGSDVVNCGVTSATFDTANVGTGKTVTVAVAISGAAAGNYTVGSPVQTTANITPKALTAVASASNKVYDGNPTASATCSIPSGIVGSDVVNCSVASATFNNSNVGTGKAVTVNITLTGASAGNYSVGTPVTTSADITPKALTATASASDKVYDGNTTATATCSLTGIVGSDTVNCGVTSATFDTASVGTNKNVTVAVAISGGSAGNYTVGSPVTTTANITARPITVTADPKSKIFGQADPALTYQLASGTLVTGDSLTGALTRVAGENVGTYAINQGTVTAGPNYAITYLSALLTISKAQQVITITQAAPASAVVNSTFNVAATGGASGNPVAIAASGACTGSGNSVGGSPVTITMSSGTGTCTVTYDQAGNANYDAAPQLSSQTTAINVATIQIAAASFGEDESQTAQILLNRTGDISGTSSITFATSVPTSGTTAVPGTCGTSNADYVAVSTTVTFNPTVQQVAVPITICKDMLDEPVETVNLTVSSPSNGVLGAQTTAVLSINDTANQFTSTTGISIGASASANPYPSTINVTGAPAVNGGMRVTLYDLTHDSPGNIDILLVGPNGQKMVIMGDAGGSSAINNPTTITFQDSAAIRLPQSTLIATGKYKPTTWVAGQADFAAPAPAGPYAEPGNAAIGTVSLNSVFGSASPNGQWRLFIRDDGSPNFVPLTNQVAGGWGLQFNTPTSSGISVSGRVTSAEGRGIRAARIVVTGNSLASPVIAETTRNGFYTIEGLTAGETYVITINSRRFTFTEASRVITLTDNVTGVDFMGEPLE